MGRCNLKNGEAQDSVCDGLSLTQQGVTVDNDVPHAAKIMMFTTLSYFIIQGPAWSHHLESTPTASLVTMIVAILLLLAYCGFQVFSALGNEESARIAKKHEEDRKLKVQLHAVMAIYSMKSMLAYRQGNHAPLLANAEIDDEAKANRAAENALKFGAKWRVRAAGGHEC